MKGIQPVFVHGWGFGPDFWAPVISALGWTDACVLDLGFLGGGNASPLQAAQQLQALQAEGRPVLGVGHSLGFLWLAQHMAFASRDKLVGINAFAVFAARAGFASGVPVRVMQRMCKGLSTAPEKVLTDFRTLCGAQVAAEPPQTQNLCTGLEMLMSADARPVLAGRARQCVVLAARQDPVVSPAMTEESFVGGPPVQWMDGGHLLPHTHVKACVALLEGARKMMEQNAG